MEIHIKRAKNMQENKAQVPFYTSPKERGPHPGKIGPKQEENRDKPKSNYLIFVEHPHRPTQEVQRSRPTKDGPIWAHLWAAPPLGPNSPIFGRLPLTAFPWSVQVGMAVNSMLRRRFVLFIGGD